ncbi:MAG: hypothetical protein A2Z29_09230 [Chloroflexi bacterium RBG_16_56_11]|nr:MAG: hypothetical protein A2Z29_09230 [Chloroflexi bacterium RBG_16_56_11]
MLSINNGKVARSTAEAFAVFYEQYMPKVFRYIRFRITEKDLAEDLTSVVFEKALTKFTTYTPEKATFSTWIFRIARNTLIDHFRASSRGSTVQLDEAIEHANDDESPEETAIASEEQRMLRQCISRLSPGEREIISLKFGADMTNRQIAGTLGISDSNVGVILFRAVRKLRSDFAGWRNE